MSGPYTKNTSATTFNGILDAVTDLGAGANNSPYAQNTLGASSDALLAYLTDKVKGVNNGPYPVNTGGVLINLAVTAAAGIAAGTTVAAFDPTPYGGLTLAGIVAALTDIANGSDHRPYTRNTAGTTLDGILDALTDIVAAGGISGGGSSRKPTYFILGF